MGLVTKTKPKKTHYHREIEPVEVELINWKFLFLFLEQDLKFQKQDTQDKWESVETLEHSGRL
jgi:hypothetical protein